LCLDRHKFLLRRSFLPARWKHPDGPVNNGFVLQRLIEYTASRGKNTIGGSCASANGGHGTAARRIDKLPFDPEVPATTTIASGFLSPPSPCRPSIFGLLASGLQLWSRFWRALPVPLAIAKGCRSAYRTSSLAIPLKDGEEVRRIQKAKGKQLIFI
jgi:hypothetical protein